jgi:hypothetical protein
MEALWKISDILQPYKDHVSVAASVITILQLLSPALLVNDIRKAKSAENFPVGPFLGGFIMYVNLQISKLALISFVSYLDQYYSFSLDKSSVIRLQ